MRGWLFYLCLIIVMLARIALCYDEVVTEIVGRDLLDMDLEEMASVHEDTIEGNFGITSKLFMRGPQCMSGKTKLVFLLDMSDHVIEDDLVQLRDWLMLLIGAFDITKRSNAEDDHKTQLALLSFSDRVDVTLHLTPSIPPNKLWRKIAQLEKLGGSAKVSLALKIARSHLLSNRNKARKIVVLMTGSEVNRSDIEAANQLKETGARLFVVGIGNMQSHENMTKMASHPPRKFLFEVKSFKKLHDIRKKLKWKICSETDDGRAKSGVSSSTTRNTCSCKNGLRGKQGIRGLKGERGLKGQKGEAGYKGSMGLQGPPGLTVLTGQTQTPNVSLLSLWTDETTSIRKMIKNIVKEILLEESFFGNLDELTAAVGSPKHQDSTNEKSEDASMGGENSKISLTKAEVIKIASKICSTMIEEHTRQTKEISNFHLSYVPYETGAPGPPGPKRSPGPPGIQGYKEPIGPRGLIGKLQTKGEKGEPGIKGSRKSAEKNRTSQPVGPPGKLPIGQPEQKGKMDKRGIRDRRGARRPTEKPGRRPSQ